MSVNKEQLFYKCLDQVNEQIDKYQEALDSISGYNAENDLHPDFDEYGNKGEMLTIYEKNTGYLDQAQQMKETLANLDKNHISEVVRPGSLVETRNSHYYVSVPLGEIDMEDGSHVYAISTDAPIYKHLDGKKVGDTFTFNGQEVEIVKIS